MTFMIILGAVAAVFILMLLLRLAALALPLYVATGAGLWMLETGAGYGIAIAAGFIGGAVVLATGRFLRTSLPPLFRLPVALSFVIPAALAGYQAATGLAALAIEGGGLSRWLGLVGAAVGASSAWRSLTQGPSGEWASPAASPPPAPTKAI